MKTAFIIVLFLGIIVSVCSACDDDCCTTTVVENTTVVQENTYVNQVNEVNAFDYGAYLDLVVIETKSTEWGFRATYLNENSETKVYAGAKIYLNRLFDK